jgi:hypothetical protein
MIHDFPSLLNWEGERIWLQTGYHHKTVIVVHYIFFPINVYIYDDFHLMFFNLFFKVQLVF